MIVITAGTPEYLPIIEAQARKCAEFGYRHVIYDLGGLGIGEPHIVAPEDLKPTVNGDSLPPATFKAALVAKQFETALPNELVVWMDADCLPLHDFTIPGHYGGFDAAVTLRAANEIGLSNNPALDYLNSGVVWIRNNTPGQEFCKAWGRQSALMNTDQGALNACVNEGWTAKDWRMAVGKSWISDLLPAKILVLDCAEWNSWHPPFTGARIAHFKRGIRYLAKDYVNR